MKRYAYITLITGLLVFLLSQLIGPVKTRGIEFKVDDLLVNVAATVISISVLGIVYYIAGEEPTTKLIRNLIDMQGTAKTLHEAGVIEFKSTRDLFDIPEMHTRFAKGHSSFIVSRNFNAFDYARVRVLFKKMLDDEKRTLKILLRSDTTRRQQFKDFINELPVGRRERIEVRESDRLMVTMYGNEHYIYTTYHLASVAGSESPAIVCIPAAKRSLYHTFFEEFEHLWRHSQPLS